MPKIVYAPILEQAGFLKRKAAVAVEQWVYRLDGASQYWQLSEPFLIGRADTIHLYTEVYVESTLPSSNQAIAAGSGGAAPGAGNFVLFLNGALGGVTAQIPRNDGSSYISANGDLKLNDFNVIEFYSDESNYYIKVNGFAPSVISKEALVDFEVDRLGAWGGELFFNGIVRNFEISVNSVTHETPLTNKPQGATQLATVGNINATAINYTEDGWEKLEQQNTQVTTSDGLRVVTSDNKSITTM